MAIVLVKYTLKKHNSQFKKKIEQTKPARKTSGILRVNDILEIVEQFDKKK